MVRKAGHKQWFRRGRNGTMVNWEKYVTSFPVLSIGEAGGLM